ncbi:MAG: aldehyde dehydrogenase [Novosphingobium sp.]
MAIKLPSLRHPDRLYIGGEWVPPLEDTQRIDVLESGTEEPFLNVAEAGHGDVHRAIDAARRAFDDGPWPNLTHDERARYLVAIGQALAEFSTEMADAWSGEVGILRSAAGAVLSGVPGTYNRYADLAATFPFVETHRPAAGNVGLLVREPVGVVAAIVPWNSPITMIAHKVAPALLAGCTVVIKTSPEAPTAGLVMAEICDRIGLPRGVVNVLTADRGASEELVRSGRVDKITFTGSSAAGRAIAAICGNRMARCTMELGGKSAGVILDDYDLGAAAASIAGTARIMTGQVCSSLTRIIVGRARHDAFVEALAAKFSATRVGDPFGSETQMGPLASARQLEWVRGYVRTGIAEGAVLATGGGRPAHLERGYYIEPTVFAWVDNAMTIAREEIFGPVLCVIPAYDEAHAVRIANDSDYGLNASVFTHDADRAYAVARKLRSGTVGHNSWRTDFGIAFGGFKQSGIGREGAREGLLPFLEAKTVILDKHPAVL